MATTNEPVPGWVMEKAGEVLRDLYGYVGSKEARLADTDENTVASALAAAYARGREDAAKVCDRRTGLRLGENDPIEAAMHRLAAQEAEECAAAIRAGGA